MSNDTNDLSKNIWLFNAKLNRMITTSDDNNNDYINNNYNYNGSYNINDSTLPTIGLNSSADASQNEPIVLITVIPITVIYVIIFISGVLGNVITCVVISRNRSMHTGKFKCL